MITPLQLWGQNCGHHRKKHIEVDITPYDLMSNIPWTMDKLLPTGTHCWIGGVYKIWYKQMSNGSLQEVGRAMEMRVSCKNEHF